MSQIEYMSNIENAKTYPDLEQMATDRKKGHAHFLETFLMHYGMHVSAKEEKYT